MSIVAPVEFPGIREQHLLRRQDNPLFPAPRRQVSDEDLVKARMEDGLEKDHFMIAFQSLVQKTVDLEPNAPSETVLEIKEELDRCYQQASALPGDQSTIKEAIRKLVGVIMQAVARGAGNDAYALQQLQEEQIARRAHFELQDIPLVAALTHPDSPVEEDELIPTLLSEPEETLRPTLQLFDDVQLIALLQDAATLLQELDPQHLHAHAWRGLAVMEAAAGDAAPRPAADRRPAG